MTDEEMTAMFIFEMRAAGVHPDWIAKYLKHYQIADLYKATANIAEIISRTHNHPFRQPMDPSNTMHQLFPVTTDLS